MSQPESNIYSAPPKGSDSEAPLSLLRLPTEVLMQIAVELPPKDFSHFIQTCRTINAIADSHYVWHQRFILRFGQVLLEKYLRDEHREGMTKEKDEDVDESSEVSPSEVSLSEPSSAVPEQQQQLYDNHEDPTSVSVRSESENEGAEASDGGGNSDDNKPDTKKVNKGKEVVQVDLRNTSELTKKELVDLYREYYSPLIVPSYNMDICHLGDRYWTMVDTRSSTYGKMARLRSVWWMDVSCLLYGVPRGRYKIQWRLDVITASPIINSIFRAVVFQKNEDRSVVDASPDTVFFKPSNIKAFFNHTDVRAAGIDRTPSKGFCIFELPDELILEHDYQNVFLQIKNHDEWKSGLCIDYVRLVNMDGIESRHLISNTATSATLKEKVNDSGEEYYPTQNAEQEGSSTMQNGQRSQDRRQPELWYRVVALLFLYSFFIYWME